MKTAKLPSFLLAIALQIMPVTRVFLATTPAATPTYAIVSTWIAGLAALMGGIDAVSGASTAITSAGTATGTNGVAFSYRITTGPDTANTFSAVPLPTGLTCSSGTGRITGTPTQSGVFSVLLTASDSGSPSRTVTKTLTLTITGGGSPTPPTISTQPASLTATNGGSATFSVTASGSATLSYQWRTNGIVLSGATNSTLSLTGITTNHAGSYSVVITNSAGSITSSTATLTVLVPPSITTEPAGQSVTEGANVSLSVVAAGTSPLSYRWRKNGTTVSAATNSTLNFATIALADAGSYTVVITNRAGTITSAVATLTVNAAPVAPTISTQPASQSGFVGGSVTMSVIATGTGPLSYQWRHEGTNVTAGTASSLLITNLATNHSGSYLVVITNIAGAITSAVAVVEVSPAPEPPTITEQPQGLTAIAGTNIALNVAATGSNPLRYQWRRNGASISSATNAALSLTDVNTGQSGDYTVVVTNIAGAATSAIATVTINNPPTPDSTRPTLTVTSPTTALITVTSNTIPMSGTAADNQALAAVYIQRNSEAPEAATGTTNWSMNVAVEPGTNTLRIWAADTTGNLSSTNTKVVVFVVRLPLSLTVNGAGTVTGATNQQLLELGRAYTLKSVARPGNVFSNWIANESPSAGAAVTFVMASNLAIVANFVTNPFAALKGTYVGLFYPETPSPAHEQSGYFTITVNDKGSFTAKLLLAGASHSASGVLDLALGGSKVILRKGTNEVLLQVQLDAASEQISGVVSNAFWIAPLAGHRATFNARSNPATNHAARHTVLLPPGENSVTAPPGYGSGLLDVTTAGATGLKGTLADGTPLAQKSLLASNGQLPVYASLYKGKGSILGWITVLNNDTNDTPGLLSWTKTALAGGTLYPTGFTNECETIGSRYLIPASGTAALNWSNGVSLLSDGNLSAPLTNTLALSTANKFTITSTNGARLALSLTSSSGLLGGSFVHPDTAKKCALKGVVLQKQGIGGGCFLGTNQGGAFLVGESMEALGY